MNLNDLLDFFDAPLTIGFDVRPDAAIEFLKAKGLKVSFSYADIMAKEHAAAFTVAKMMDADLLAEVKASLEDALETGIPFNTWKQNILPLLQQNGWVGRQAVVDPLTGQTIVAALGTPGRLQTIFRTNLQSAYAVGQWEQISAQAETAPYLMYDAIDDYRTRPEHAARDGQVHPINSKFWKTYYPPCGWNCRCSAIQLSDEELDELGLTVSPPAKIKTYDWTNPRTGKVEQIPEGVDPGFGFNAGIARMEQLAKLALEKAAALPPDAAAAYLAGIQSTQKVLDAEASLLAKQAIEQARNSGANLAAAANAAERAAKVQITKALAEKTPYLSKAITEVQKSKAGATMTNTELLAVAKEKAAKLQSSAWLSEYKKAATAGKTPNPKAQAAFDALPDEAKQAITEQIDAKVAALKADAAAQAALKDIAEGKQGATAMNVLAAADASLPPQELLALVQTQTAAIKAANNAASAVSAYKKAILAGKVPTANQKAAFDALAPDKQAKLLADIDKAKAKAAPAAVQTPAADFNPDSLTQIGPQKGSNPGGLFQDTTTGTQWYIKFPPVEQARNEVLAARLYAAAGLDVPDIRLVTVNGKPAIASKIVDGLSKGTPADLAKASNGFVVDAWLANWDVVGLGYDNLLLRAGTPFRVDTGGALRFRAQGGLKGSAWGDEVLEIDTLRNPGTNPQAASVFGKASQADLEDGARKVLAIPEANIRALVDEFGPLDARERDRLLKTLLARREDIARRFPNARPEMQTAAPVPTSRVTPFEQREIEASRVNGYALNTDGGDIEDHHVVAMTYTDAKGAKRTRLALKLRPEAAARLQQTLSTADGGVPVLADFSATRDAGLELLKGLNALAGKGEVIRADKEIPRLVKFKAELAKVRGLMAGKDKMIGNAAAYRRTLAEMERLEAELDAYFAANKIGDKAVAFRQVDFNALELQVTGKVVKGDPSATPWKKKSGLDYTRANITNGNVIETTMTRPVNGVSESYLAELPDGTRIRYVPDIDRNAMAARGYAQIDVDGVGVEATERALRELERLGLPTARTTPQQRLELYLDRHLYLRATKDSRLEADWLAIAGTEEERIAAKLALLNKAAGFDVRTSPNWNPEGMRQAFGHGRTHMMRADLRPEDVQQFNASHVVFHNPAGLSWNGGTEVLDRFRVLVSAGGQLASQMDRIRRGVQLQGTSVGADFTTGGASYVFTRLSSKTGNIRSHGAGFILKPQITQRLDAFSYSGDRFGNVDRGLQRSDRGVTLDQMSRNASSSGNETNFRDSVSLFDAVEYIVLSTTEQVKEAIAFMRASGYSTWPDGRALDDVIIPVSKSPYKKP